ncbi:MAG TPA: GNAT family protein [Thermomicrobiaceae bacterium]|nr:GNAT family protein [Thermomicrobiaceae bacterium]
MSNERDDDAILTVVGKNVALGPLRRDLLATYHRWNNTVSTSRTLGLSWPTTIEQEAETYEQRVASANSTYFTVYEAAARQPIGVTYLYEIDHRHRRATFGITIGDAPNRGKGYGTEATRLVLDYAFTSLGLSNVMLTLLEFNIAGYRAYQNAGFREFGRRTRCSFMNGRLWDLIYMQALADNFVDADETSSRTASPTAQ